MTLEELKTEILYKCLKYFKEHGELNMRGVFSESEVKLATLAIMLHEGNLAEAARRLKYTRTALSEKLRYKGSDLDESKKWDLAQKYGIKYVPRTVLSRKLHEDQFFSQYRESHTKK